MFEQKLRKRAKDLGLDQLPQKLLVLRRRTEMTQDDFYSIANPKSFARMGYLGKVFESEAIKGGGSELAHKHLSVAKLKKVKDLQFMPHELLFLLRMHYGDGQEAVGDLIGRSRVWVNMYENGKLMNNEGRYDKMTQQIVEGYLSVR